MRASRAAWLDCVHRHEVLGLRRTHVLGSRHQVRRCWLEYSSANGSPTLLARWSNIAAAYRHIAGYKKEREMRAELETFLEFGTLVPERYSELLSAVRRVRWGSQRGCRVGHVAQRRLSQAT